MGLNCGPGSPCGRGLTVRSAIIPEGYTVQTGIQWLDAWINSGLAADLRLDLLLRLLLAVLLGGAIGWEREASSKPAGLRTNVLICLGATLLTNLSIRFGGLVMGAPESLRAAQRQLAVREDVAGFYAD